MKKISLLVLFFVCIRLNAQKASITPVLRGTNYSNAYYDIKASIRPAPDHKGLIWTLESKGLDKNSQIRISTDNIKQGIKKLKKDSVSKYEYAMLRYQKPILVTTSSQYNASLLLKKEKW